MVSRFGIQITFQFIIWQTGDVEKAKRNVIFFNDMVKFEDLICVVYTHTREYKLCIVFTSLGIDLSMNLVYLLIESMRSIKIYLVTFITFNSIYIKLWTHWIVSPAMEKLHFCYQRIRALHGFGSRGRDAHQLTCLPKKKKHESIKSNVLNETSFTRSGFARLSYCRTRMRLL